MASYKMLKTQDGVRKGEVHPVTFHEGETYELDDGLAAEFGKLDAVEPSNAETAQPETTRDDLHEGWLDTDPSVLRHGELTAAQVIERDESPFTPSVVADQVEGNAEGEPEVNLPKSKKSK